MQRSDVGFFEGPEDCVAAVRDQRLGAVQICRLEYQRTQDPTTGMRLAEALNRADETAAAKQVAAGLLDTRARADALYLLGLIARDEDDNEVAKGALQDARRLHALEMRHRELARDDGVLAMVLTDRSEFAAALELIDECITQAQLASDRNLECYCHVAAATTLIRVGYGPAAEAELDKAESLADSDQQRRNVHYQRGTFAQESGNHAFAITQLEKALKQGEHSAPWTVRTYLNLAYSLAEIGRLDDAQRYLADARLRAPDRKLDPDHTWVAAQIAYRQHDLATAASLVAQYFELLGAEKSAGPEGRDERIEVAVLGARIELERNDLRRAEQWAQRGFDEAEEIRRTQSVLELRPWVLAKRRAAYELRFTSLAHRQDSEAAAMAFDAWQGRTVQDALATPRPRASLGYRGVAAQITNLGEWLRVASQAAFARSPDRHAVLHTMQGIDLLALIVANGEVWSLVANHGPPRLTKIKPLAELEELIKAFRAHPTDARLAAELGALLLPESSFRKTGEVLHVIVDAELKGLPVAALRHGATPLIARRPMLRVLRLPETRCAHVNRSGHATVLAAPDDEIPLARVEAIQVAGLLHTTSQTDAAATKAALYAAADDAVLHVAAHGTVGTDGAGLVLSDGEVSALELTARRLAPSLAVLTACDSAASDDPELAGSLAAGFLGAGSQHVVATLRPISDTGGLEIAPRFYRAGGVADPARALAEVQRELAKTDNTDWPNVVVFGPDVCPKNAADHR